MEKITPIDFNVSMVRAINSRKKDQTRRAKGLEQVNKDPDSFGYEMDFDGPVFTSNRGKKVVEVKCPYGKMGDYLWVRERHRISHTDVLRGCEGEIIEETPVYMFEADKANHIISLYDNLNGWTPAKQMAMSVCRRWLKIKMVFPVRIQDMKEYEAISEGIFFDEHSGYYFAGDQAMHTDPVLCFSKFWDLINDKSVRWDKNPWVWRILFEQIPNPYQVITIISVTGQQGHSHDGKFTWCSDCFPQAAKKYMKLMQEKKLVGTTWEAVIDPSGKYTVINFIP